MKPRINVEEYNPEWAQIFESLKEKIWPVVKDIAIAVEHVGSTSVPGLAAKPVIDMDVVVDSADFSRAAVTQLQKLGYSPLGEKGIPGREAFRRPADSPRHHLYVCLKSSLAFKNHIVFRNFLRENKEASMQYADLKMRLAEEYAGDSDTYCEAKTAFILKILENDGFSKAELLAVKGANIVKR